MAFYPQLINLSNNLIEANTGSEVTGGLGYFDLTTGVTKYAFQATVTPFNNTDGDRFELVLEDKLNVQTLLENIDSNNIQTTASLTVTSTVVFIRPTAAA